MQSQVMAKWDFGLLVKAQGEAGCGLALVEAG